MKQTIRNVVVGIAVWVVVLAAVTWSPAQVNNPQTDASQLTTGTLPNARLSAVPNSSLATVGDSTIKGGAVGAGTATPTDLTATQAAAIVGSVGGALKSKMIASTRALNASSGTISYTGFGFVPTSCEVQATVAGTTIESLGRTDSALANMVQGTIQTTPVTTVSSGQAVRLLDATSANGQVGTVSSYDADGLSISYTIIGAGIASTADLYFRCFR